MAISWPRKSSSARRDASRVTSHNIPQVETLSRRSGTPWLYRLAATFDGIAMKSAPPRTAQARNWSGFCHNWNRVPGATSSRAPESAMRTRG